LAGGTIRLLPKRVNTESLLFIFFCQTYGFAPRALKVPAKTADCEAVALQKRTLATARAGKRVIRSAIDCPLPHQHFASLAQVVVRAPDERVNEGVVSGAHFSQADGSAVVLVCLAKKADGGAVGLGS
jgi:hypothetical protein